MADPEDWPEDRSYKKFNGWFDIKVSDTVIDLGIDAIVPEEY